MFHESSLVYIRGMHPMEQHYVGGSDYALASFGLEKIAIMSAEQRAAFMKAREGRPTGLEAIQGASGDAALAQMKPSSPVAPSVPGAASAGATGASPSVGGPGMAPGFGGRGLPLETPLMVGDAMLKGQQPSRMLPTSMTGAGSIRGQAAQAEMAARRKPVRAILPDKLASLRLPTA